jgi:hypothetical protein
MPVEYFMQYDRESRGRRVELMSVEAVQRRLAQGKPVDWERVHRHFSAADPNLRVTVERLRDSMLGAMVEEGK